MPPPPAKTTSTSLPYFIFVDCCVAATAAIFVANGPSRACASHQDGFCVASGHVDASRPLVQEDPHGMFNLFLMNGTILDILGSCMYSVDSDLNNK